MGKYDTNIKCVEVRRLVDEKQYKRALELADSINIDKVHSIIDLKVLANVYERAEKYEEAKEILLGSYEKKVTKSVLYKLTYLSLKTKEYEDAEYFYEEFSDMAPNSQDRYILRYAIDRAKGVDYYLRIATLQTLKHIEYMEEWGYELAKLYHKAGLGEDCVAECDDIILWFGVGTIVEKAKLLRTYHLEGKETLEAYGIFGEKTRAANFHKSESENSNTKDLSEQITAITENQKQAQIHKELRRDLEKTVDLRQMMREDADGMDLLKQEIHRMWGGEESEEESFEQEDLPIYQERDRREGNSYLNQEDLNLQFSNSEEVSQEEYEEEKAVAYEESTEQEEIALRQEKIVEKKQKKKQKKEILFDKDQWLDIAKKVGEKKEVEQESKEFIAQEEIKIVPKDTSIQIGKKNLTEQFGEFVNEPKTRKQIIFELNRIHKGEKPVHFVLTAEEAKRAVEMGKDIGKALKELGVLSSAKVARITAEKLNKIHLSEKQESLRNCCMLVEKAGDITADTAQSIMNMIEEMGDVIVVILTDSSTTLEGLLEEYNILSRYFKYNISL